MPSLLETSAVRIVTRPGGAVVGAGFLANENIVLTCAHVIAEATGIADTSPTPPGQPITLDFPLMAAGQWLTATVVRWVPVQSDGSGDIAVMRLEGTAPAGVKIARLVRGENHWEHPFRTFGYPRQQDDGVPAAGKLTSLNAKGWIVMQTTETTGFRVQQGFSGGAVWDGELDGIAGMVVAEEQDPAPRVAYMIPSRVLIETWPDLGQQAIPLCPYRGLLAFREQDAPYFFGREADIQRLMEAVRRKPLVAVIGASGSGKSSLVYAGLLPRLRKEGTWAIATLRPGARPLRALATTLLDLMEPQLSPLERLPNIKTFAEQLGQGEITLSDVVDLILHTQSVSRLLLFVDQFEELYTECKQGDERQRFLDLLLSVQPSSNQGKSPLVLACTLRADFLGQVLTYRPLTDALQQADLKLGPMTRSELQEAISKPAEKLQVQIEEGLTRRILEDIGEGAGNLPLLEFALTSLWARQQNGMLTHTAYETIGGVKQALTEHAEAVWEGLSEEEQAEARHIFTHLVHPGEGTEDTRRVATRAMLGDGSWELVTRLANERLVVTGRDMTTDQETVEVIHEALIRDWQRLRDWIESDRKLLTWLDGLRATLRQWEQKQHDQGILLRGALLVEALDWLNHRPDTISAAEQAFIRASQEQDQQERERLQALLEESERRRQEAEHQQQIALARNLAAQADLLSTQYAGSPRLLERSTLLALEAIQRFICLETFQAARQGMERLRQCLATLEHGGPVDAVAFSPNGRLLATASRDQTVQLWDVASSQHLATLPHKGGVPRVAFSSDGRLLATASVDSTARVWDVTTCKNLVVLRHGIKVRAVTFSPDGRLLATSGGIWDVARGQHLVSLQHDRGEVMAAAFSPDGRLLATACLDYTAGIWDVASGQRQAALQHEKGVWAVAFSPDGRLLATASEDGTAGVWDVASGQRQAILPHQGNVKVVTFSPDGRLLATASKDGTTKLWNVAKSRLLSIMVHGGEVSVVAFSPNGRLLATASWDATAGIWDVSNGQRLATLPHNHIVCGVAFSPDGRLLATASEDNTARLWDVAKGQRLAALRHDGRVYGVAFSPDGCLLATGSVEGTAGVWDVSSGQRLVTLQSDHHNHVVAFSPDGRLLATGSVEGTAGVWDVSSGQRLATLPHEDGIYMVVFSPDGRLLATASEDHTAGIWDVSSGQRLATLPHSHSVYAVAFSPDGRLLATASEDHTAGVWDVTSGQRLATLQHEGEVLSVAFNPDGRLLATASYDHNGAQLWDVASSQRFATMRHDNAVDRVAFSPDGSQLATACWDRAARVWDVTSGQQLATMQHESKVSAVAFSPDGRLLATASEDFTAGVWDVTSGQRLAALHHESKVSAAAFSPDGRLLATASEDNTARLWLHLPEDVIVEAHTRLTRNLTPEEWQQYLGDAPYRKTVPDLP